MIHLPYEYDEHNLYLDNNEGVSSLNLAFIAVHWAIFLRKILVD